MAASAKHAAWALTPAFAVLLAFWLLPLAHLMVLGAESRDSNGSGYWQVLSSAQYLGSLGQTLILAVVVTFAALVVGGISGVFLARHQFFGRSALVALLTFPLAFPGVVVLDQQVLVHLVIGTGIVELITFLGTARRCQAAAVAGATTGGVL